MYPTVVIPTYNEVENLPKLVFELFQLPLDELSVLIVDDKSPDGTGKIAEELSLDYPGRLSVIHRQGKLGLGTAYIRGFRWAIEAGAELIAQMDADFSHTPDKLLELVEAVDSCDVVLGSRYVPGGNVDERWALWRKALSAFGNIYARAILRLPISDATGGFKVWRRQVLESMPLARIRSNGYSFQVEMSYVAHKLGFTFKEVPIYFADRKWGTSKMSFDIQREAAIRVWRMLYEYRNLKPSKRVQEI